MMTIQIDHRVPHYELHEGSSVDLSQQGGEGAAHGGGEEHEMVRGGRVEVV